MLKLRKLSTIYPNQLWLNLSQELQKEAWQQSQLHSNAAARCQAYLNYLCLKTFVPWLEAWLKEANQVQGSISDTTWDSLWEFVNGTPIELEGMRLVLIPNETSDLEEFAVPCEWVDIPSWRKDYYLAVQINLGESEQSWLRVWGFASYEKLKQQGIYDESDRTYYINQEVLAEDFTQMLLVPQQDTNPHAEEPPLQLSVKVAQELLVQLSKPGIYLPRLAVPFDQWAALLTNEQWRQQLYNQRLGLTSTATASFTVVNLRQWLEKAESTIEKSWQAVETLLTPPEFSAVRGTETLEPTVSSEAIAPLIRLLQSNRPEKERCQAAGVLGQIGIGHPEVVEALTQLLRTANDEETRWEAALSLGKIAPEHPQAGVSKARLIDLGMQLGTCQVALIVTIRPKTEEKIGVRLQVQPINQQHKLPPNLQLSVISGGETRLQAQTRSDDRGQGKDKLLQLGFSPPSGTQFQVRVTLDGVSVSEDFLA
ncbi:hypothetical protein WA1_21145 [Scytonema hofmannii PCC 7110]|uniref:DUF1822 domain-containing protein n=1 Tax=Scytonema hofmannii PCC 7110 TaxID=128403 RepID=A0A139XCU4_9CYAN|nr:DUF1822 family protein [Scytonema hofmannii]KYC42473.1 hypothetical protein WA1_21145 [Scytonema hofmannii PCC 7110]